MSSPCFIQWTLPLSIKSFGVVNRIKILNQLTRFYSVFLILLQLSCSSNEDTKENTVGNCDFPRIVVEAERDTVKIGNTFRAKVSLSDTSVLTVPDPITGKETKFFPAFWINGDRVDVQQYYYIYETVVDSSDVHTFNDTKFKEWVVEIGYPRSGGLGDVKLSQRLSYVIESQK